MKSVVIIGAGTAGLTAAGYLARSGYRVTVMEKNAFPGGRCAAFITEGYRFDIGATLLMMPQVYERTFAELGKPIADALELQRLEIPYRLYFPDGQSLDFSSDLARMQSQLEKMEPGSFLPFLRYMDNSIYAYRMSMKHIIDRNYDHIFQFINPSSMTRLLRVNAFGDHYRLASKYFRNENLRTAFTFQNIYVGQDPFHAPAIFSMLPFMELTDGVFFPIGGMNRIAEVLESIALENGTEILYRTAITGISVSGSRVKGVVTASGDFFPADIVLANADLPYVYQELLPRGRAHRRISRLGYTCSALVMHWGMDTVIPGLEQHNIFVSDHYRENIGEVFSGSGIAPEPSFYVHSPVRGDKTAAPEGQDSLSVIIPVGHLRDEREYDWEAVRLSARALVLQRLAKEGFPNVEEHIKFEKVYNPPIWQNLFNLSRGATFGSLNHNLMQMGYFRPHNQHSTYRNLFFAGGSTHPGNGVPLALISARLACEKISRYFS
ncbi:MAG: phytoene desaturase family protein [Bacteroidales bacterium]|nr:phytoene desaturase family protein [Bacteroidales bacterium]